MRALCHDCGYMFDKRNMARRCKRCRRRFGSAYLYVPKAEEKNGDVVYDDAILRTDAMLWMGEAPRDQRECVAASELRDTVDLLLKTLDSREEKVLRMRFGIGVESDYTLEEVGQDLAVIAERVRQIEARAIRKLRQRASLLELV